MDANALDSALAECLSRIEAGQATVADCLERYPHLGDLGPLLHLALGIRQTPHPEPDPDWFDAARRRLEQAVEPKPERLLSAAGPAAAMVLAWRWSWESSAASTPQLFALRVAAVFSMLLLLGGNAVTAAEASLPGSPLYSLKLAAEEARVAATFDPASRAALHLQIAGQRLSELAQAQYAATPAATPELALAAQSELRAALADLETAAPGRRTLLTAKVQSLTARPVAFSGTVKAASPEKLLVQGVPVYLTADTAITGDPAAGSRVAVRAKLGPDGAYRATEISVLSGLRPEGYRSAVPLPQQQAPSGAGEGAGFTASPVSYSAEEAGNGIPLVFPGVG